MKNVVCNNNLELLILYTIWGKDDITLQYGWSEEDDLLVEYKKEVTEAGGNYHVFKTNGECFEAEDAYREIYTHLFAEWKSKNGSHLFHELTEKLNILPNDSESIAKQKITSCC